MMEDKPEVKFPFGPTPQPGTAGQMPPRIAEPEPTEKTTAEPEPKKEPAKRSRRKTTETQDNVTGAASQEDMQ